MRKLWVKAWMTFDGVFDADTMDYWWQNTNNPERMEYIMEQYSQGDIYMMGRITYEMLWPGWSKQTTGPGEPLKDGGVSPDAVRHFTGQIPVLGVCLGHQCLGAIYGGKVDRAPRLMHGKTSPVYHNGQGIFANLPSPFEAMRYHSLVVYDPVPDELEVTAKTPEGEIMGLKHKTAQTYGVQFHPESILTEHGKQLLQNFLNL